MSEKDTFLLEIFKLDVIKFGNFVLKSGLQSPFYIDLRSLASNPPLLKSLAIHLLDLLPESHRGELICGVPYAALPMATVVSITSGIPLIIKRKEYKGYGTKKMIEGIYNKGQSCVLIEDVITTGSSLMETLPDLKNEGLKVSDILIVIDREQGGKERLVNKGYRVHSLFTITEIVNAFKKFNKIDEKTARSVLTFIQGNHNTPTHQRPTRKSYKEKLKDADHPISKRLLEIALEKKTNLICSADLMTSNDLLQFVRQIGSMICALKLHIDIIEDFTKELTYELKYLSNELNFLIIEDRKFADIGNTVQMQFESGIYNISNWADMITIHITGGEESLIAIKQSIKNQSVAIIPIVQMSTKDTLTDQNYCKKATDIIQKHKDIVIGAVAQSYDLPGGLLKFVPGVNLNSKSDNIGQKYQTPQSVISQRNADFLIVGRGIYQSDDPYLACEKYQIAGWNAYNEALEEPDLIS